ncbi:hypothetical protein R1flu_007901 [Riccia fluitans]|uniref:Uncharacterized protein n=1 Tax=Riccia fluitans TaxID=41844 RepID=A0ABD1Z063_9MARC
MGSGRPFGQTRRQHTTRSNGHHLILVGSTQERGRIFNDPAKDFNGRYMRLTPWTPDYDTRKDKQNRRPLWVDITYINPGFQEEGIEMLKDLGTLLHVARLDSQSRLKFPHVRGLVLIDPEINLLEAIVLDLDGVKVEFTLEYEELPEDAITVTNWDTRQDSILS